MQLSRIQSRILAFSILVIFLVLALLLSGQSRHTGMTATYEQEIAPLPETAPAIEQPSSGAVTLKDFHRSETRDGRMVWEVKSARGQYFPLSNSARVEDAVVRLYRKDGSAVEVVAGEAMLEMNGAELNKVNASKGVKLVYNSEVTLDTDSALYDRSSNKVTAPGFVKISGSTLETTGIGLTADLETQTARLDKDVQSVIQAREDKHEKKKK